MPVIGAVHMVFAGRMRSVPDVKVAVLSCYTLAER